MVSKKKITAMVMTFILCISSCQVIAVARENDNRQSTNNYQVWSGKAADGFAAGDGTPADPYIISNGEELKYFADRVSNGDTFFDQYIVLSNDIYLNDISDFDNWSLSHQPDNIWKPIDGYFGGTLDGDGHSIVGLYIFEGGKNIGFFRQTSKYNTTTIKNLSFKSANVDGDEYTGIVVGHAIYLDCINVKVDGVVTGTYRVGGIVGGYSGLTSPSLLAGPINLINCTNYADVKGTDYYAGGLIGYATNQNFPSNDKIVINGCYNRGNVKGSCDVGGLCGYLLNATDSLGADVMNSSNEGKVTGYRSVGGIFGSIKGDNKGFYAEQVCNYGDVIADTKYAGGIAGEVCSSWCTSSMADLYNVGNISANSSAGGLAGRGSTGTLGYLDIQNFYNLGKITAETNVSAGIGEGVIDGWYGHEEIRVNNAYYDSKYRINDTSITTTNAFALERNQFKSKDSFTGFDFDNVWGMMSYGPVFLWQSSDQKCGENAYWSVSGDLDNLTLHITGFGDTYDYDVCEASPWHYKYRIKKVVISDSITSVGSYLFAYGSDIESVHLGNSIDKIKDDAFMGCKKLKKINIPSSVVYIGNWCFHLSGLEQVEFEGNAPGMADQIFRGLTLEVRYDAETEGWEDAQKKSYGGNLTWMDMYGTFKTNYVKFSYDLIDHSLPGIPSKDKGQYAKELYSWAVEYGYGDILTRDECEKIISETMPSVVSQDENGTYVTYAYTTASIMRDILMINSTKKALTKWENKDITNAEVKDLVQIYTDVNKIIDKYNDYEEDTHRSALSSVFYTVYSNKLLKSAGGVVINIAKDYFVGDLKEDLNNLDFKLLYTDFFDRKVSLTNLDIQMEGIAEELAEQIKADFPKTFTEKVCKGFIAKVIEQNDDVNSFVKVYNELSSYTNSFKGNSIIAQFCVQSSLPVELLKIYVDLMKNVDEVNQGKYFMLQYSLMRYYPDLYDQIIDTDGNVIDLIDSYMINIDSAFIREQLDNWYNKGGSAVQLSDKQKVTLSNTAALVMELQSSDPTSMKRKLVEYWYRQAKNSLQQESTMTQNEIIMNANSEFTIQKADKDIVGVYTDHEFKTGNSLASIKAISNESMSLNSNAMNVNDTSQILYADDDILVELGATGTYVHVIFTQNKYRCVIDKAEGELYLTDMVRSDVKTYKYSTLMPKSVVIIDENPRITTEKGEIVPDDLKKQSNTNQGNDQGNMSNNQSESTNGSESDNHSKADKENDSNDQSGDSNQTEDEDKKDNGNGIVEKGELDASGMYRAISETEAAFAPIHAIHLKTLIIADRVVIDGVNVKVTVIAKNACRNNKKIEKVVVGKNVRKIRKNAFKGCRKLRMIRINSSNIEKIEKNAFKTMSKSMRVIICTRKKTTYDSTVKKIKKAGVSKAEYKYKNSGASSNDMVLFG